MVTRSFQLAKILGADGDIKATALDSAAISSGVTEYATADVLPSIGNSFGDQALVTSNNRLYIWNGSGWYNIALVNQNPSFTTSPAANYEFDGDSPRNDITITVAASDPESLGVSFSFETGGSMDSMASVTQDSSVFTLSPKGNADLTDGVTLTGSLTIKATDGVNVVPAVSSFTLTFITTLFNTAETQILMKATGTGDNTTFLDGSTSNHTVTRSGDTEQHAFSPFRENGYSMFFDGTGDYLQIADDSDFDLPGEFAYEFWLYRTGSTSGTYQAILGSNGSGSNGLTFYITQSNGALSIFQSSFIISGSAGDISDYKWHHVLLMRDSSNLLQLFIDGYRVSSSTNTTAFTDNTAGGGTRIGYDIGANGYFKGYLTDIRLIKGSTGDYSSGASITVPTERLTGITNTKLLIGGNGFRDEGPTTSASQKSLYFGTNSNNYLLNYGDQAALEFGTNSWTIEAWIYSTGTMSNAGIFSRGANGSFWHSLHMTSASTIKYVLSNGAGQEWNYTSGGSTIPTNTWVHVALVRRFGTDIKLYVNGTAIKTDTSNASTTLGDSTADFKIGFERFQGSGGGFNGYISNFRFVNGTAVYTGNFTTPTSPLTNVTNTVILHHGLTNEVTGGVGNPSNTSVTTNDLSPFNSVHTITPNGDVFIDAFTPYNRGGAYDATTDGGSALFDGNGDYLTISSADTAGTGEFTAEAWFYAKALSTIGATGAIMAQRPSSPTTGNYAQWIVYTQNTGNLGWYNGVSGQRVVETGAGGITTNRWYHVAITRNSSNIATMWLNGVSVGTRAHTSNWNYAPFTVGANGDGTAPFNGFISNVRWTVGTCLYTSDFTVPTSPFTAGTNTKLLLNMTNAKVFDASQSRKLMSFASDADSPVASSGQQHFGENTIFFDGTGDYIVMDNPIKGLEDHTHEAWVYPTAGHSSYKGFFASAPDGSGSGINVSKDLAGGPNNSSPAIASFNPTVPDNEWSHVVLQRQSGVHSLYRNGVLQGTSTATVNFDTANLRMASRYNNTITYAFGGYIHDFRVSKGLARYPYISKPVTLTQTNSGMEKPDGETPTATASNTKLLAFTTSTITSDASASNHTLTASNSAAASTNAPAIGMHSVYIPNGDVDIISTAASSDHQIYGGDYTVEAWLYVTTFNSHGYWISKGGNTSREWGFGVTAAGLTTYWNTTGSGGAGDSSFIPAVTNKANEWFHVAFTKSGSTLTTFKNGNILGTGTFTSIYGGNGTLKIGRLMDYTGIAHSFNGYISNLRIIKGEAIYSKDFTPSAVAFKG